VLAALVASPCTAPFMGAALGYAMTQPTAYALAVFAALGIGMALPYVLLSFYPAWLKRLPRPGPWLDTFKQFLAFPMYATVVWLTWVLLLQTGVNTVVGLGAALVLLALGGWLLGRAQGAPGRAIALVAFAAALFIAWPTEGDAIKTPASTASSEGWQAWSQEEVAKLTAAGTPVFVDFTAAWCVTCQVNKRTVLETTAVRQAFAAKGVTLLRADWTRADPKITQALASFGRNGVPVYVFYAPGKAPVLLPEVLREQHVMDALKTL
jgi:thiol:disulfide interchange protein